MPSNSTSSVLNSTTKTIASVYFENLDGLRSVAFLMVFIQHSLLEWSNYHQLGHSIIGFILSPITHFGEVGVSIFFVLSGYLITYFILQEIGLKGTLNLSYFYMRRILRIWPLYYAVVFFACNIFPFILFKLGLHKDLSNHTLYYLFLSNFDVIRVLKTPNTVNYMIQAITWSVSVEEQFYLVWPLLIVLCPKKYYKLVFICIILATLVFRFLHQHDAITLYYHSLSVCADLALGGLCAYYSYYTNTFKMLFKKLNTSSIVIVYCLLLVWIFFKNDFLPSYFTVIINRLIGTIFFAFVIAEHNYSNKSFYKFSNNRILSYWGKYTYGLYLLHPIVLAVVLGLAKRIIQPNYYTAHSIEYVVPLAFISLLVSLVASYLSYEYYEKQFLKFKRKFSFITSEKILSN